MQDHDNNNANDINQFSDGPDSTKISFSLHNIINHHTLITIHI